jgi:uncharacterized protein
MSNWEIRSLESAESEIRAIGGEGVSERGVEGYGIVFNKESVDLGGFTEIILPEAINGVLERSDILGTINHNVDRGVLARYTKGQGSMTITVDSKGVKYAFAAPKFNLGDELLEGLNRGDIRASSFAFSVITDIWEKRSDGTFLRTIKQFDKIYDMSAVYSPAYQDTTVARRSIDELNKVVTPEIETKPVIEEPITEPIVGLQRRAAEIELQYRQYKQEHNLND